MRIGSLPFTIRAACHPCYRVPEPASFRSFRAPIPVCPACHRPLFSAPRQIGALAPKFTFLLVANLLLLCRALFAWMTSEIVIMIPNHNPVLDMFDFGHAQPDAPMAMLPGKGPVPPFTGGNPPVSSTSRTPATDRSGILMKADHLAGVLALPPTHFPRIARGIHA